MRMGFCKFCPAMKAVNCFTRWLQPLIFQVESPNAWKYDIQNSCILKGKYLYNAFFWLSVNTHIFLEMAICFQHFISNPEYFGYFAQQSNHVYDYGTALLPQGRVETFFGFGILWVTCFPKIWCIFQGFDGHIFQFFSDGFEKNTELFLVI